MNARVNSQYSRQLSYRIGIFKYNKTAWITLLISIQTGQVPEGRWQSDLHGFFRNIIYYTINQLVINTATKM